MRKKLKFLKLIIIFIGSIIAIVMMSSNIELYKLIFSGEVVDTNFFNILSFFTVTTTILAVLDIKKETKSKYWFILVLFASSVGTLIYSFIQLIYQIKEERYISAYFK